MGDIIISNIIKVNVGGTIFETAKDTLLNMTYFQSFFERWDNTPIFIDRDPIYFSEILNQLKGYKIKEGVDIDNLKKDCDFYGVNLCIEEDDTIIEEFTLSKYTCKSIDPKKFIKIESVSIALKASRNLDAQIHFYFSRFNLNYSILFPLLSYYRRQANYETIILSEAHIIELNKLIEDPCQFYTLMRIDLKANLDLVDSCDIKFKILMRK